MKIGLLKNFLHYFNLRQGTILIAIFQLVTAISIKSTLGDQFASLNVILINITVLVRIQYDILHSGSGTRNGDPRNGGERHRRCPREGGLGGDIVEPSQHKEDGPGASQRNRLLTHVFTRGTKKVMHEKRNHPSCRVIICEKIFCICRNGVRDVLRPRHHSYPFHLHGVTSLRGSNGNRLK